MIEQGTIAEVRTENVGSYLTADAALGATQLAVEDATPFEEAGGLLSINGAVYTYLRASYGASTLTLVSSLSAAALDGEEVAVYPAVSTMEAVVMVGDSPEGLDVRVPHNLRDRLPEGMRDEDLGEAVEIESLDNGEWVLRDVLAKEVVIDGSYLGTGTVPMHAFDADVAESLQAAADAAAQALADAEAAMDFAETRTKVYRQGIKPTGGTYAAGDVWFNTADGNRIYIHNGTDFADAQDADIAAAAQAATEATNRAQDALDAASEAQDFAEAKNRVYRQDSKPTGGISGDTWFDSNDNNRIYVHDGTDFVDVSLNNALATAQAAADGAIRTFYQSNAPWPNNTVQPDNVLGDLWFDLDTDIAHRWNGTEWKIIQDDAIGKAIQDAFNAQQSANSALDDASEAFDRAVTAETNAVNTAGTRAETTFGGTRDRVNGWTFPGSNLIDGGDIKEKTVTTNVLNVIMGGGNLVQDSGFEAQTTLLENYAGATSIVYDTTEYYRGSRSLKVTPGATPRGVIIWSAPMAAANEVAAGEKFIGSFYFKGVAGAQYAVSFRLRTATNGYLTEGGGSVSVTATGAWQRVQTNPFAHNVKWIPGIQIVQQQGTSTSPFWVDLVQIEAGDVATAYATRTDEILPGTVSTTMLQSDAIKTSVLDADAITAKHRITGALVQTTAEANRGIKMNSTALITYNAAGQATLNIDAATGAITMLGALTSGSSVTGALVQTQAEANRGVKMNSTGLYAYDGSGASTLTINGSTGSVTMKGSLTAGSDINGATVTGSTVQSETAANRGVKFNTTGLAAYSEAGVATFSIDAATGDVGMIGELASGSLISGARIVGVLETSATAARGIKLTNAALTAYDGAGAQTLSINATTGAVVMKGSLTAGSDISGATITASSTGVIQTEATANRGVKINSAGLTAYDSAGAATLTITGSTGAVAMKGSLVSGSTIAGATITGVLQTSATVNRGIKVSNTGLTAYDANGGTTLTIDGTTGSVAMKGTLTSGSVITGASFQTADTGKRVRIASTSDKQDRVEFYSGLPEEVLPTGIIVDNRVGTSNSFVESRVKFQGATFGSMQDIYAPKIQLNSTYFPSAGSYRGGLEFMGDDVNFMENPYNGATDGQFNVEQRTAMFAGNVTTGGDLNVDGRLKLTGTNSKPIKVIDFGAGQFTPDANGLGTFDHNLGLGNSLNYTVMITSRNNGAQRTFTITNKYANSVQLRVNGANGAVVTSGTASFDYVILNN